MLSESIGEGFDDGIAASCRERGHVEDAADGFSSAADGAFALVLPAVVVEGSNADEGRDLLSVEGSEFGEIGDEGGGGNSAESGYGLDEFGFLSPIVVGLDKGFNGFFDVVDLTFQKFEDGLNTFLSGFGPGQFEAIGFHDSEVDELSSAGDELLDFGLFFWHFLDRSRLDLLSEQSQDAGIKAVGLGGQAQGSGKVPNPFGINDRDAVAGIEEVGHERAFIAAGGLEDDQAARGLREEFAELLEPRSVVGQRVRLACGEEVEIERRLGDVDADADQIRAVHGDVPFLPMRARGRFGNLAAQATVRARFQRPATIQLCDGVWSAEARSIYRRPLRGWLRSQPRSSTH
jgi:hypothetical protein